MLAPAILIAGSPVVLCHSSHSPPLAVMIAGMNEPLGDDRPIDAHKPLWIELWLERIDGIPDKLRFAKRVEADIVARASTLKLISGRQLRRFYVARVSEE
jgi:hypothetical protein